MKAKDKEKVVGHLGECMKDKVTLRFVFNTKVTAKEIARIKEQAQASDTSPYDVIVAETDKQIREL